MDLLIGFAEWSESDAFHFAFDSDVYSHQITGLRVSNNNHLVTVLDLFKHAT
jgi:hypothetical protein